MSDSPRTASSAAGSGPPPGFHRLKPRSSVRGGFFAAFFFGLIWTVVTVLFLVGGLSDTGDSPPAWLLVLMVVVNLLILIWPAKSFLRWIMTGQTTVDVNMPVAFPGEPLEIIVCQPGRFQIDKCTVDFACEERARYQQGTDTVTRTEIVRQFPLCELTNIVARDGQTLTHQTVRIPEDAMLSFEAKHNEIHWLVRVNMVIPKRPDTEQLFPVKVSTRAIQATEGASNV